MVELWQQHRGEQIEQLFPLRIAARALVREGSQHYPRGFEAMQQLRRQFEMSGPSVLRR